MGAEKITTESIRDRYSRRSYDGRVIEKNKREAMEEYISVENPGPFGSKNRSLLFAGNENSQAIGRVYNGKQTFFFS